MKKLILLSAMLLCGVLWANAQNTKDRKVRFDLQLVQSFGLNDWSSVKFASNRLPRTSSSTDLRASLNIHIIKRVAGIFGDMGVGIMPAPRNGLSDPAAQATSTLGARYYTKEITLEEGNQSANAHFKMTFGIFGKLSIANQLSMSPYLGIGFMTVSAPTCEAILKEHNSNMQYIARYQWFGQDEYDYGNTITHPYLAFRLRFAHHLPSKRNLLFGVEYTWFAERANFSESYTNYFNYNIVRTITHKGNQLNMLGFSVGISF